MTRPAAAPVRRRRPAAMPLWGDGFADDGFTASNTMTDWALCSPDEYAMLFPRLLPQDGKLPAALVTHLEACVAARSWRQARLDPASPVPDLRARIPADIAAELHRGWFADDGALSCLLRQLGLLRTAPDRVIAEGRLLVMLDRVLDQIQRGLAPVWSEDLEAWFAFGSGIHSAYLWAESALSPARACTAAWLGHLDRGRTVLMPPVVADYLTDAVLSRSAAVDRCLAAMTGTPVDAERLRRAAAQRLAGGDPAVRFGRGAYRAARPAGAISLAGRIGNDALEHA